MFNKQGINFYNQGKYKKAIESFKEAKLLVGRRLGRKSSGYVTVCDNLALLYLEIGLIKKAESLYLICKEIQEKIVDKNHPDYANSCSNLATVYQEMGDYKKAEALFIEAKDIDQKALGKNHPSYATDCSNLAVLYQEQDLFSKSEQLFLEAMKIEEKVLGKNHLNYARTCSNLALLYKDKGLYNKAEKLLKESRDTQERITGKDHVAYAEACSALGSLYETVGMYNKAEFNYEKAKNIYHKVYGGKHPMYIDCISKIAGVYENKGRFDKAELLYKQAKKFFENVYGTNHYTYATICSNLGALYYGQGIYKRAENLLLKAREARKQSYGKIHSYYSMDCGNLAQVYDIQGQDKKAERLYFEAKNIDIKVFGKKHVSYAGNCNYIGLFYNKRKYYKKAKRYLKKAKRAFKKYMGDKHPDYAYICNNLGLVYSNQGLSKKAELLYLEAKRIFKETVGTIHPAYLTVCGNLIMRYQKDGTINKNQYLFQEILSNIYKQIKYNLSVLGENDKLKFIQKNVGHFMLAYNSFGKSFTQSQGIEKSASLLAQMYNNQLFMKASLFYSSQAIKRRIRNSRDSIIVNDYKHLITKRKMYIKMLELSRLKKQGTDLNKMHNKLSDLEKRIARKSRVIANKLEEYIPHKWQEIQAELKTGEVAIELIKVINLMQKEMGLLSYAALILTPKSKYPEPVFFDEGVFLEKEAYQYYIKHQVKSASKEFNGISFKNFWNPIHQRLKKIYPQAKRIYLSVDGVYHKINLETLWNPTTKKYLGEELDIELVSNTKDLLFRNEAKSTTKHPRAYVFGAPDYKNFNLQPYEPGKTLRPAINHTQFNGKQRRDLRNIWENGVIPYLPNTKNEVEEIQKHLAKRMSCTVFTSKQATEENIKALRNPTILHLATHGYFMNQKDLGKFEKNNRLQWAGTELKHYVENPLLRTGLVWTGAEATLNNKSRPDSVKENGILTAQEVLNLTLDSTELVVLSACETGRGKIQNGEGVYGLQRAFLSAGAKYVLMSLWKVDDDATRWFMQYFYEDWLTHQNIRKAYRNAQQRLRKKYPAPYHWGAFVLVSR